MCALEFKILDLLATWNEKKSQFSILPVMIHDILTV